MALFLFNYNGDELLQEVRNLIWSNLNSALLSGLPRLFSSLLSAPFFFILPSSPSLLQYINPVVHPAELPT